ncbi:MAG: ribonuclease E/G, partial [Rhodospirillaceae bacterium]
PGETRIAELQHGRLVGLTVDRAGHESRVGDIVAGQVEAVIHNLQAAFVDIGEDRAGYLSLQDARPHGVEGDDAIGDYLNEGDTVLVQITRDQEAEKGAKLTMKTVLTGRDLVFTPGRPGISLSRRITDAAERDRLSAAMADFGGAVGGFILRTTAQEAEPEDLVEEGERLENRWVTLQADFADARAPQTLLHEPEPACRLLRDQGGVDLTAIVVDDAEVFQRVKAYAQAETPDLAELVQMYRGAGPLFRAEGVDEQIEAVLDPWVPLPSGGNLRINETEALVAVDVNTGSAAGGGREQVITDVNCEAAEVFA